MSLFSRLIKKNNLVVIAVTVVIAAVAIVSTETRAQAQSLDESLSPKQVAQAHRQLLIEVTSDATPDLDNKLTLLTNDANEIIGFHFTDGKNISANYSLDDLKDRIVLYKQSKLGISKDINYISADRFDAKRGGAIELTLLREFKSIFSFDYRLARMWVRKSDEGKWQIAFDDVGKTVVYDTMFFKGFKRDGDYVGTEAITFFLSKKPVFEINTRELRED